MKKIYSFLLCMSFCLFTVYSQNLLKDSDFEAYKDGEIELIVGQHNVTNDGVWYQVTEGTSIDLFDVTVEQDTDQGTVALMSTQSGASTSWWMNMLSQKISTLPQKQFYKLSFDAKSTTSGATISAKVYCNDGGHKYILRKDFDPVASPLSSGSTFDIKITTDEWTRYEVDFDFSQICNSTASPSGVGSSYAITPTSDEMLATCRLDLQAFKPLPCEIYIDNIKLEAVIEYIEVPDEGPFLLNRTFEDIETIERVETEFEKYLNIPGEWFFYAEPGLAGIDFSTAEVKQDAIQGNVASLINGNPAPSWWGHVLKQRLAAKAKPMSYRVGFYAKSTGSATATIMVTTKSRYQEKAEFILVEGFDPVTKETHSGARYDFKTSDEWTYYEGVFDFAQKCNSYNSPKGSGADYAITSTDDDFLANCYFELINNTASSELFVDNIVIEEVETNTEIRNPGFEDDNYTPIKLKGDLTLGQHSGRWVLVNKTTQETAVSVYSDDANTGTRSMKLDITDLGSYPRYNCFIAMDLYEVPAGKYVFKFASKATADDVPFRLDAYLYYGSDVKAITGTDGENINIDGIATEAAGLKMFKTELGWTNYEQKMTVADDASMMRIFIRPNIDGLGAAGAKTDVLPMSYYFDDFSIQLATSVGIVSDKENDGINIYHENGTLFIKGIQKADVSVYAINGTLVKEAVNVSEFNSSLSEGTYVVKIVKNNGVKTTKVLIN